jgi:hypothetical protein
MVKFIEFFSSSQVWRPTEICEIMFPCTVSKFRVFIGKGGCMFSDGEARAKRGKERAKSVKILVRRDQLGGIFGDHCKVIFKNAK